MNIGNRVKKILFSPRKEWQVIAAQHEEPVNILRSYILPLVLIGAGAAFIGHGFIGDPFMHNKAVGVAYGVFNALNCVVVSIITVYIIAVVLNELAPSFESTRDISKSFQLVAYGATPILLGQLFAFIPVFENIAKFTGAVYAIYLWRLGLPVLKNTPSSKNILYLLIIFAGLIMVYAVVGVLFAALMFPLFGV